MFPNKEEPRLIIIMMEGQTNTCDVIRDGLLLEGFGKSGCGW